MARGRIVSPDFWTDSVIVGLSIPARLFYVGTWNFACDKGHLTDDAMGLKLKILPADQVDADAILAELMDAGRIVRMEVLGKSFLHIPTFEANQAKSKDARWKSRCAACRLLDSSETSDEVVKTLPTSSWRGGEGSRGESRGGEETQGVTPTPFCPRHPTGTDAPCAGCKRAREAFNASQRALPVGPSLPLPPRVDRDPATCVHDFEKAGGRCRHCLTREEDVA